MKALVFYGEFSPGWPGHSFEFKLRAIGVFLSSATHQATCRRHVLLQLIELNRLTCTQGVICRRHVLQQLVAWHVHREYSVADKCCCNLSPCVFRSLLISTYLTGVQWVLSYVTGTIIWMLLDRQWTLLDILWLTRSFFMMIRLAFQLFAGQAI